MRFHAKVRVFVRSLSLAVNKLVWNSHPGSETQLLRRFQAGQTAPDGLVHGAQAKAASAALIQRRGRKHERGGGSISFLLTSSGSRLPTAAAGDRWQVKIKSGPSSLFAKVQSGNMSFLLPVGQEMDGKAKRPRKKKRRSRDGRRGNTSSSS